MGGSEEDPCECRGQYGHSGGGGGFEAAVALVYPVTDIACRPASTGHTPWTLRVHPLW